MSGVVEGFLALLRECKVFIGDVIAFSFSDLRHAFVPANRGPIYSRHRGNPPTPPIRFSALPIAPTGVNLPWMRCIAAVQTCVALLLAFLLAPFQHVHAAQASGTDHDHSAIIH